MAEIDRLREDIETLRGLFALRNPMLASLFRRLRIIADPVVGTCGVNQKGEFIVNPEFWAKLDLNTKVAVLGHETYHIAFRHPQRQEGKDPYLYNIAGDAIINGILRDFGDLANVRWPQGFQPVFPESVATAIDRSPQDIAKMSADELYGHLKKNESRAKQLPSCGTLKQDRGSPGSKNGSAGAGQNQDSGKENGEGRSGTKQGSADQGRDQSKKSEEGRGFGPFGKSAKSKKERTVIQEGDPDAYGEGSQPKDQEQYWNEALATAWVLAKAAGNIPAGLELALGKLLKPKVPWMILIKQEIQQGLSSNVVASWQRPSRKHPWLPGKKMISVPTVYVLVDVSGSIIGSDSLNRLFSEIAGICKTNPAIVFPWDAEAYLPPYELARPEDIVSKIRGLKGGGGTVIGPVLREVLPRMKYGDIVAILTDGYIFDIEGDDIRQLLMKIRMKTCKAIFATTDVEPKLPSGWRIIKIQLE